MKEPTAIALANKIESSYFGVPESGLMRILSAKQRWSVKEFYQLTDRIEYWVSLEMSKGRLIYRNKSRLSYLSIVTKLHLALIDFVEPKKLGQVFSAGMNLRVGKNSVRRSSVVYISNEQLKKHDEYAVFGFELAIEVLADGNRFDDKFIRRREYAEVGIPEYWLVDPKSESITVLKLAGNTYAVHGKFKKGQKATSVVLAGFDVDVTEALAGRQ